VIFPRLLLTLAMLFVLGAFVLPSPQPALAQYAAAVDVDSVRIEPLSQTVPVIGRLVAKQSGIVAARIGGPVADMRVSVGDHVKEGDILAVLDGTRLKRQRALLVAETAETEALIKLAEAQLALRRQEFARIEGLRDSAAFSRGRHEDSRQQAVVAETSLGAALARHERALANLALAEIDLRNAQVRAPYTGVITLEHTAAGSFVSVGSPVVTMLSNYKLEIEADVPAAQIPALEAGVVINIALDDGTNHDAIVRTIVPEENPLTRTRQVRFTLDDEMSRRVLAVNQSVLVHLPLGHSREVVTVHKDAVINRGGQSFVYIATDGKADMRRIKTGAAVGGRFEVLSGLVPGELTVIRGNERLRPGQDISIGDDS